jgi:hypothetical protein
MWVSTVRSDNNGLAGSSVVTTRLSREAMKNAAEVTAKVHAVQLLTVMIVYMAFSAIEAQTGLTAGVEINPMAQPSAESAGRSWLAQCPHR